jgi:hypothetical protein
MTTMGRIATVTPPVAGRRVSGIVSSVSPVRSLLAVTAILGAAQSGFP